MFQSAGGAELDDEYSAFLDDMGESKKQKLDGPEKPYVPPMGDLASRTKALGKAAPRLMLTNGSAAPGASIKAAKYDIMLIDFLYNFVICQESFSHWL